MIEIAIYRFTGNPFVDAGIAGMCAVADVCRPEDLCLGKVHLAVKQLLRLFTSPQALEARAKPGDPKSSSAFATSEISAIFPNGPLANAVIKPADKPARYTAQITGLEKGLSAPVSSGLNCFVCGKPASLTASKMNFPLVDSGDRRNFHPGHNDGHPICAACALAVQFLPLSVLRSSPGGLFWFLSTFDSDTAIKASRLTVSLMDSAISRNDRVRLYGDWSMPGKFGSLVSAISYLTEKNNELGLRKTEYPASAFFFSNDNRGADLSVIEIPNALFRYFNRLRLTHSSLVRMERELLQPNKYGEDAAWRMLHKQPIVIPSTVWPDQDKPCGLLGGWLAHALYMKEVLNLNTGYIKTVEAVALRIAGLDDPTKELKAIQNERKSPMRWFLRASAKDVLSREELYTLMPPNDFRAGYASLDYVAAAASDAVRQLSEGKDTEVLSIEVQDACATEHPLIVLVEKVGAGITASGYNAKGLLTTLRKARRIQDIRRAWLRVIQNGAISWEEFKSLVPPDDFSITQQVRDYMIAYLIDLLRGSLQPDELQSLEMESTEEILKGDKEVEEWQTL